MKKFSILLVILMAFGLMVGVTGCGGGGEEAEGDKSEKSELAINAATEATFAPFEYQSESGEIEGFDADLIKAIGEAEGMEVNIKHMDWDGLFPALQSGDVNVVIAAMTINDERKKVVDFSEPYFESKQTIAVKEDSTIASLEELVGKPVGVQQNTTGQFAMEELKGVNVDNIKKYPTVPDALMNLQNGSLEAVVADAPVVQKYLETNPDSGLKTVTTKFEKEYYGIAVNKGDKELLSKINEGLDKIKKDGTYDEIYKKYFAE